MPPPRNGAGPGAQAEASAPADVPALLEELRIHQAELSVQNDELRRAEQEATLSRARYMALFRQMPLPAFILDATGAIEDSNERADALLGPPRPQAGRDLRLSGVLARADHARLVSAARGLADGQPGLVTELALTPRGQASAGHDAHLIRLGLDYHLDARVMVLLIDRSEAQRRERERQFFSVFLDSTDDFVYATDLAGRVSLANRALLRFLGRGTAEVVDQPRDRLISLRDALAHRASDQQVIDEGQPVSLEEHLHASDGARAVHLLTRKFPLQDADGRITGIGNICTDITELKAQQHQSMLSESMFLGASESILILDAESRVRRVNPAFSALTGFSESAIVGQGVGILRMETGDPATDATMRRKLDAAGHWAGEMRIRAADGHQATVWNSVNAIRDEGGHIVHYVAIQTDLTPLREAQSRVEHLASFDSLTGLPNRALFNDRLGQLIVQAQRHGTHFSLLFVDLDHFKEVNDTLGHQVGDELLKSIAHTLRDAVRNEDTVARMGGDEFVVLLPGADPQAAMMIADKLLARLRTMLQLGPRLEYQPAASLGIASYPQDGPTGELLLRNADTAMYQAKLSGRNRAAVYTTQMSENSARAFSTQTELSVGIDRDELRLHFQPVFDLRSGVLRGAEALVRWQRPGQGLVFPGDFLPVAERTGLVAAIDQWVMAQVLAQLARWRRAGLWRDEWHLAVNQNVADLRRPTLVDDIAAGLARHGLPATCLEFEITEGALLDNTWAMIDRLRQLRSLGVSLAIDDFGTGFSSLSYLRKLPISVIKVDQSFVRDMLANDGDEVLVQTIIAMAHKLGHATVAEGIECEAQRARLAELGCVGGQGFFLGRPVAADLLEATLERGVRGVAA